MWRNNLVFSFCIKVVELCDCSSQLIKINVRCDAWSFANSLLVGSVCMAKAHANNA